VSEPEGSDAPVAEPEESRNPHPIYNWMSGIGVALASVGLSAVLFQIALDLLVGAHSGYSGLALLPALGLTLVGVGLVVAGWLRERRRQRRGVRSSFFETWIVDPWGVVRQHGWWYAPLLIAVVALGLFGAGAGTVGIVEYSESNQFCTETCHAVMGPEGATYAEAPHSRIACVSCHVGAGPEGFFAAKLGGMRQLYALATDTVSRPIPTPIHPSHIDRELCESCHAPERDAGIRAWEHAYYPTLDATEPTRVAMVLTVSDGGIGALGGEGVHYHMQISRKVEYVARDAQRLEIAWVRVTDADGATHEYELDGGELSDDERAALPIRTMQCTDCHSRPAHPFPTATDTVNRALDARLLPRDLPSIKEVGVLALDGDYDDTAAALVGIEESIRSYYEEEEPELLTERSEDIDEAVDTLQALYQRTIFPEMKADWRAHPDHSGHLDSPGCFRCHNDQMLDADGDSPTTECASCHAVIAQDDETIAAMDEFESGRDFVHPEDGGTFEEFTLCSDCHDGGALLYE